MSRADKDRGISSRALSSADDTGEPAFSGPSWGAVAALSAGAALSLFASNASAGTIIQDNFTSGSQYGVPIAGNHPTTTNLPGANWQQTSHNTIRAMEWVSSSHTNFHQGAAFGGNANDAAVGISLAGFNSGILQTSADVFYNNVAGSAVTAPTTVGASSYVLLGFNFSTGSASNYGGPSTTAGFTGLQALANGSLQEYVEGTAVGSAIGFVGTYDPLTSTHLAYSINTATGAISNVSFGSSTALYNFGTGTFSSSDTAFLQIGGNANPSSPAPLAGVAYFTDVNVSNTPEPTGLALMLAGIGVPGLLRRRIRRRTAKMSP